MCVSLKGNREEPLERYRLSRPSKTLSLIHRHVLFTSKSIPVTGFACTPCATSCPLFIYWRAEMNSRSVGSRLFYQFVWIGVALLFSPSL